MTILATTNFGELDLYAGATEDFPFTALLFDADGITPAVLASNDVVHFALSERTKGEPRTILLDVRSDQFTANKSKVILSSLGTTSPHAAATGYVHFGQADTDAIVDAWASTIASKRLVGEAYYVDASETNPASAKKIFLRGVIHLHRSAAQA